MILVGWICSLPAHQGHITAQPAEPSSWQAATSGLPPQVSPPSAANRPPLAAESSFQRREATSELTWQDRRHFPEPQASPVPSPRQRITVEAAAANKWREGQADIWYLRGPVTLKQGDLVAVSNEAVLWIDQGDPYIAEPDRVIAYLEGNVAVEFRHQGQLHAETGRAAQSIHDQAWLGRLSTVSGIQIDVAPDGGRPDVLPDIYARGLVHHRDGIDPTVQPAQFVVPVQPSAQNPIAVEEGLQGNPLPPFPQTEVLIKERASSVDFILNSFRDPERNEQVWYADRGVRVTIRSQELGAVVGDSRLGNTAAGALDTVVILADRAVGWTRPLADVISADGGGNATADRWEFYLEGNIVFAYAERVIYAERMYYDVNNRRGTILNAEMLTPVPDYEGLVRLKASILQQIDRDNFRAYQAAFTSSRMGYPRYWLQAGEVAIEHDQRLAIDPLTGQPAVDYATGELVFDHQYNATSRSNLVYVGGVPVFYWPTLATDLADPTFYLTGLSIKNDGVFGTQALTTWDLYQVLGIRNPPENTDWTLDVDYMSERGVGLGTQFEYQGTNLFGFSGPYTGRFDAWGINEQGLDNLGEDRRALVPEQDLRGRVLFQHRQRLDIGWQLTAETGLISDRNFLEQYYEQEWDQNKDQSTGIELKRIFGNQSISIGANVRLNDFYTQDEWLPRFDHFILGQPLLFDRLNWSAHSHVGYARLNTADAPLDPNDANFRLLPWEADVEGVRAGTRHELSLPFAAGPLKVSPYLLGDLTYWEEDLNQNSLTRLYGQAGLRANLPIWKVNPAVEGELFNLNGMAHKVDFNIDAFWADASEDLTDLPLYDSLDDDAQEQFRRRFAFDNFGGALVPFEFDERSYALRRGMQGYVTSPTAEVADDLFLTKVGIHQRWQTKRGAPGRQRVVDWIRFDVNGTFFPDADRDNFGVDVGMVDYDFRWNLGDRFAVMSDGFFDFFGDGLRTASIGATTNRPELGSLYLGYRSIEGPITSNIVTGSLSYRMSEKWIATAGTSVDFGPTGNIGQTVSFTRIGESFLVRFGLRADASRGNVGAVLGIEPRFLPRERLNQVGGVYVPPPGTRGPE